MTILFWIFSLLMIGFGAAVVLKSSPIASALSLVVSFLGLAALFVMLDAYFIGVIQILVYAGAVMVLFLFIIMLLDLRAEQCRKINVVAFSGGVLVALAFFFQIYSVVHKLRASDQPFPPLPLVKINDVHNIGLLLFDKYNLPFQIIAILVLVATIGVIVLSKRELK